MWHHLHSFFGLLSGGLLIVLAITGAILATVPLYDGSRPEVQHFAGMSVADAIKVITRANPELQLERIRISPSHAVVVSGYLAGKSIKQPADLTTGVLLKGSKTPAFYLWVRDLHRSLLLGFAGRVVVFVASLFLALICISGTMVLVRRMGGWSRLFAPVRGRKWERVHAITSRLALLPLVITAVSGVYAGSITMGLVPSGEEVPPVYPESLEKLTAVAPHTLHGLRDIDLADMREVLFPIPEDWFDVFAVKTHSEFLFFDQFTGDLLSSQPYSMWQRVLEFFTLLHTAEGAAPWGIIVGIAALAVPVFALTGTLIWLNRQRSGAGRIGQNVAAQYADIVIAVGSENNTTWGFAKYLHGALTDTGLRVQTRAMNDLRSHYPRAKNLLVLAATYGDGDAPENANRFGKRLADVGATQLPRFAVLGFGDKSFSHYCKFAHDTQGALVSSGRKPLLDMADIDRGSAQSFARWGAALGEAIGVDLVLDYVPPQPKILRLRLLEKQVFGQGLQSPTVICRLSGKALPKHAPGDLLAVLAPGTSNPRFYSLASHCRENCIEICVARQEGGVCSSYLNDLQQGDNVELFVKANTAFHMPQKRRRPVIMISAGTGIAPFAGMIRNNMKSVPIDLFWGNRHPNMDFLYEHAIQGWLEDSRLTNFYPAFSRIPSGSYVQDQVRAHSTHILTRLKQRATIMVCGGTAMAEGVREEIEMIAAQLGSTVNQLKRSGRYLEDTY